MFVLSHQEARKRAVNAVQSCPEGYIVEIKPPTRNLEQNAHLHAALTEYGKATKWQWRGYDVDLDDLKSIFVGALMKSRGEDARMLPGMDGKPFLLGWRSRDLSKGDCAEVIEMIYAEIHHAASSA